MINIYKLTFIFLHVCTDHGWSDFAAVKTGLHVYVGLMCMRWIGLVNAVVDLSVPCLIGCKKEPNFNQTKITIYLPGLVQAYIYKLVRHRLPSASKL